MSLPGVLSAMRRLILDDCQYPSGLQERTEAFVRAFPNVTRAEAEDLARMPADRLQVYTTSIFTAQSKILSRNLAFTFLVLKDLWPVVRGSDFSSYEFVRELHRLSPWTDTNATYLGSSVVRFLETEGAAFLQRAPYLRDIAAIEHLSWEARKGASGELPGSPLRVESLTEMQVETLLSCRVTVPANARFMKASFDVAGARATFLAGDRASYPIPETRPIFAAGGRTAAYTVQWVEIPELVHNRVVERGGLHVSGLAEAFVESLPSETEEEAAFISFAGLLVRLMNAGVVVLHLEQ